MRAVVAFVGLLWGITAASLTMNPFSAPKVNCGEPGMIWGRTFNLGSGVENYVVGLDPTTFNVVYNATIPRNLFVSTTGAYDALTGTLVLYDGVKTLQLFNSRTRTLVSVVPNQVVLPDTWTGALDMWYDEQGTLWGMYFTPPRGGSISLVTIDISGLRGVVKQQFTVSPSPLVPDITGSVILGSGAYDPKKKVYIYAGERESVIKIDIEKQDVDIYDIEDLQTPVYVPDLGLIVGVGRNNTLLGLNTATMETQVLHPKVPGIRANKGVIYDSSTKSFYLTLVNSNFKPIYRWWTFNLKTKQEQVIPCEDHFQYVFQCPMA